MDYLPDAVEEQKHGIPLEGIKSNPLALFYAINTYLPGALPRVYGVKKPKEDDEERFDDLFFEPSKIAPNVKLVNDKPAGMEKWTYTSLLKGVENCACEREEAKGPRRR